MHTTPLYRLGLIFFSIFLLAGCGGDSGTGPPPPAAVASVEVTTPSTSLTAGQTMQLSVVVKGASGNALSGRTVSWSSDKEGVATISTSGLVTGVASGDVSIRATVENHSGQITLAILPIPVAAVTVSPDTATVQAGATVQLNATPKDASGNPLTGRAVVWSSSDTTRASVSASGQATAMTEGSVTITAASEGKSGTAQVAIVPVPVATLTISPDSAQIQIGGTQQFTATAKDASGNVLTGRAVTWASSDMAVATISSTGLTTGEAAGQATITAESEGKRGTETLTVTRPDTEVGGIINDNTSWTLANSPYRLVQNVQIAYGATLTIEPGVEIEGAGKSIEVWGALNAIGNASSRIQFDSTHVVPRGEPGESFLIQIEYAEMHRGSLYAPTGNAIYGSLQLRDSRLYDLGQYLYVWYPVGESFIERNVFVRSGGISVGADTRTQRVRVYIRNNAFVDWATLFGKSYAVENWASYGGETTIVQYNCFLNTDRIALRLPAGYSDALLSATDNYWGTTDEAVIQSMIYDRNDDLNSADVIEYRPFLTQPHPDTPSP